MTSALDVLKVKNEKSIEERLAERFAAQVKLNAKKNADSYKTLSAPEFVDFEVGTDFHENVAMYFNKFDPFSRYWIADCARRIKKLEKLTNDSSLTPDMRNSYRIRALAFGHYMKQNYLVYYTVTSLLINDVMFLPLKHLLPLFMQMIKVLDGKEEKKISIINIFSGAGKSEATNNLCTYELARNKDAVILQVSASDSVLRTNAERIRKICSSKYFGLLFGHQLEKKDRSKITQWAFKDSTKPYNYMARTYRSAFLGASAGGTDNSKISKSLRAFIEGELELYDMYRADLTVTDEDIDSLNGIGGLLLLDDPQEEGEAPSLYETDFSDFTGKIISRARGTTPIVLNQQRVDYNDLSGNIMRHLKGLYVCVKVPVLDDSGMLMKDCANPVSEYKVIKEQQKSNPRTFACMYQQQPLLSKGEFFKEADFVKFTEEEVKDKQFDMLFITCDTAITDTAASDYTVIGLWGTVGKGDTASLYMLDMVRGKWAGQKLFDVCKDTWVQWKDKYQEHIPYYIEYIAAGILVYDVLKDAYVPVKEIDRTLLFNNGTNVKPPKGKAGRVARIRRHYERNKIYVLDKYFEEVMQECTSFREDETMYDHDDIVDVLTDAVGIVYNGQGKRFMGLDEIAKIRERFSR